MTPDQFASLINMLLQAFGPWLQVWLILFLAFGVSTALMVPIIMIARRFLENSWSS